MVDYKAPIEKYPDIKRFFILSDTHFGVRSNSVEWLEIQRDYFYNWFIPMIKENYREGDALIHCGDVFDSRQSLNLRVMNTAMEIFEELSKILPVFIICGNHDIYHKKSNEINSIKIFNWLDNVHVYEQPVVLNINSGDTNALLMPWKDTQEEEQSVINANPADYLFCHTDIRGLKFNSYVEVEHGLGAAEFTTFKKVYSGHIHFAQTNGNIRMVGCPLPMTRSDIGNTKSIWTINFENDEDSSVENHYSPKFIRMKLENVLEKNYGELKEIFKNNFVDILVHSSLGQSFPFSSFLDAFAEVNYRKLNYIITTMGDGDEIDLEDYNEEMEKEIDLLKLISLYIDNLAYSDSIKGKLKKISNRFYHESIRSAEEEVIG